MDRSKWATLLLHALFGWAACGAIMGIGPVVTSMRTTLLVHAIAVPFIFAAVAWIYFSRFDYTSPLQTAMVFVAFAVVMDAVVVSALIVGNFTMFASVIGTWLPLASMGVVTCLMGAYVRGRQPRPAAI